ncbi:MAG: CHASE4 domain-containing protein [Methanobacteriaceae archaeon]|nr:CHASE4 domain-containing protein [Methanobacteriaceae archaeon]
MKLRTKTLLLTGILFMALILVLFVISQTIFISTFNEHERQYTSLEVRDVNYTLNNEISSLKRINTDWAEWDDAYSFVEGNNPDFIETNLQPETFSRLNLNLILFIDNDGQIIYGKGFNLKENRELELPSDFNRTLALDNPLININSTGNSGIIITQYGPMIISSHPILRGSGSGPIQGTIIIGRFMDQSELNRLSVITNSSISLEEYNSPNLSTDFKAARSSISDNNPIYIQEAGPDSIAGYIVLNDVYGNPALILKTEIPRIIYQDYQRSVIYLMVSLVLLGLLFGLLNLYYLDKNLLNRLDKIVGGVETIGKTEDLSQRVYSEGADELADLGLSINEMLDSLEKSENNLKESEKRYRNIFENTGTSMVILDKNLDISLANNQFKKILNSFKVDLESKNWNDFITITEGDKIKDYHYKMLEGQKLGKFPQTYELELKNRSGKMGDFLATFNNIPGTKKILVSLIDISDRKKAENKIKESLKEKEALLREIHHRVKNNMQIISSLISLQSNEVSDEDMLKFYKETENRLHAMALVHENLYQSTDLSHIDLGGYLKNLVEDLIYSYGGSISTIQTDIEVPKIEVNLETAIPLGLIINELVSNSIKHAFPDKKGIIKIKLDIDGDQNLNLMVGDNGIGLPEDKDIISIQKFGLKLVQALTSQLDGELTIEGKSGTCFHIKFKELEYKKRF